MNPARNGPSPVYPNFKSIITAKVATGVWCEPKPELITGRIKKWAEAAKVETTRVPGYRYNSSRSHIPAGSQARLDEKVFYHFHRGAYVLGSASPSLTVTPVAV